MGSGSVRIIASVNAFGQPNYDFIAIGPTGPAEIDPWKYVQQSDASASGLDASQMINRAIQAAASVGGGMVRIPAQSLTLQNPIIVSADSVQLAGRGRGSQLIAGSGFPNGSPMIWYQGPGSGFRQGARIRDLLLTCSGPSGVTGVQLDSTYHASIERVDIEGVYAQNIYLNGAVGQFGAYTHIRACHIGNVPGGASSGGIGILTNNHEYNTVRDCVLNWFSLAGGIGVKLANGNNVLDGVTFDECDTGAWLDFTQNNTIIGCQFDRGLTQFIMLNGAKFTRVTGNYFGTFAGVASGQAMLHVSNSGAQHNIIADNQASNFGTQWPKWLIEDNGVATPANLYAHNETLGLPVTRLSGIFRGNSGYNPLGQVTVTVGASPYAVPVQGVDVTYYLSGGTGVSVAVGGVTLTGMTSGPVRVPAGASFTVTYTSAPTVTGYGE